MKRILRWKGENGVESRVGLKKSEVHDRMNREPPDFPRPVPLGTKAVGWLEEEIDAWIDARAAEREAGTSIDKTNRGKAMAANSVAARRAAVGEDAA